MSRCSPFSFFWLLLAALLVPPGVARAQTATVTYDLVDVWLRPDITHPTYGARPMTGTFVWTYTVGDFENGSGQFLSYSIPWWGSRTTPGLDVAVEVDNIEFTMQGNYHGLGLGVNLRPVGRLSPNQPVALDTARSAFDIEVGVSFRGHAERGRIVPRCETPQSYGVGSPGSGGRVPGLTSVGGVASLGSTTFGVEADQLLGGAPCVLLLGASRAQLSMFGATVLVDPASAVLLGRRATGAAGAAGAGSLRVLIPIPGDPALVGSAAHCQVLAVDAGAPQGVLAATPGLTLFICP